MNKEESAECFHISQVARSPLAIENCILNSQVSDRILVLLEVVQKERQPKIIRNQLLRKVQNILGEIGVQALRFRRWEYEWTGLLNNPLRFRTGMQKTKLAIIEVNETGALPDIFIAIDSSNLLDGNQSWACHLKRLSMCRCRECVPG